MANWGVVRGAVIHHTVDPMYQDHDSCLRAGERIERDHQARGYHDDFGRLRIAYNELWCPHFIQVRGRGFDSTNDANGDTEPNRTYYAIALLDTNPAPHYWEPLLRQRITAVRAWCSDAKEVVPHRDIPQASTLCPGDRMAKWCRNYVHVEEVDDLPLSQEDLDKIRAMIERYSGWNVAALARVIHDREVPTAAWLFDTYKAYIADANARAAQRERDLHSGGTHTH